jgi:Gas vesicle synthesis protein GvpO
MAEQRRSSRRGGSNNKRLSGREAIERVRRDFPELLGRPIEQVLGLERDRDDGWKVRVQVVELSRIPPTTDVLGTYSVTLDRDGEVTGYRRERRFHRNQADED